MKTRILTLTGMVLIASATMTNAENHKVRNTSAARGHEHETRIENSALAATGSAAMTCSLEEWIASRESWEQESEEMTSATGSEGSSMLVEWVISRDKWEQEGQGYMAAPFAEKSVSLEEWIAGCESWEQESSETTGSITFPALSGMEEWIAELANWEQK